MNVSNLVAPLLAGAQAASAKGATPAGNGVSGLAELFAQLLEAAHAELASDNAAGLQAAGAPPGENAATPLAELVQVLDGLVPANAETGEVSGGDTDSGETLNDVPVSVLAALAALFGVPVKTSPGAAAAGADSGSPGGAGGNPSVSPAVPLSVDNGPNTGKPDDAAAVVASAGKPASPDAHGSAAAAPGQQQAEALQAAVAELVAQSSKQQGPSGDGTAQPAPPAQAETGAGVVAAVREAKSALTANAAGEDQPQGQTLRQLLSEIVGQARRDGPAQGGPKAAGQAILAQALDLAIQGQSDAADDSQPRAVPVGDVRQTFPHGPARGDTPPVHTASHAQLPQSVEVRDLGDFTVRSVRYLSGRTDQVVTVRLVPRSLGEMHVAVRSGGDGMEVVLSASTPAARDAIELHLGGLRDALTRGGIDVARVSVQTFTPSSAGHQQHAFAGQQASTGHQGHSGSGARPYEGAMPAFVEAEPETPGWRPNRPHHDGGLNMFV